MHRFGVQHRTSEFCGYAVNGPVRTPERWVRAYDGVCLQVREEMGSVGRCEGLNNTAWECVSGRNDYTLSSFNPSLE